MIPTTGQLVLGAVAAGAAVLAWPMPARPAWTPGRDLLSSLQARSVGVGRAGSGRGGHGSARALVPEALELVALALLGGGSLAAAVSRVAEVLPDRPGRELAVLGARLHEGVTGDEAWDGVAQHWVPARRSLQLAEAAGVAPGVALTRAAEDLRRDALADVEVAAARLGVRLVAPLGLAYLPAFVLTTVLPVVLALTRDLTW